MELNSFLPRKRAPLILQTEAAECGLACLAMVASAHGYECDLTTLRSTIGVSLRGVTLSQLIKMAGELKLSGRALRLEPIALQRLSFPAILHWNLDHFVVLERATSRYVWISDPALGRTRITIDEASKCFTGIALELAPTPDFQPRRDRSTLKLSAFFKGVQGLRPTLFKLFLFSLTLQAFALVTPFFTQIVVDEVVVASDTRLLATLAIGFLSIALINSAITAMRSLAVLYFSSRLQFGWSARLFHHLIRLPLSYFERRHMGDIQSRFRALDSIQNIVTGTVVEAVIDGLMGVTTLIVMLLYAPSLTLIPIGALTAYFALRGSLYSIQREAANESLIQSARQESHFLESLRGIVALKSFSKEHVREAMWQTRLSGAIRAKIGAASLSTWQQLGNQVIFSIENITVIWFGALLVIKGSMSIGMLIAFFSYRSQFSARVSALIDKYLEVKLQGVSLDRLSDIALTDKEARFTEAAWEVEIVGAAIEIDNVRFRYANSEPYVLNGLSLSVRAGECLAIYSPSGTGKTTLLKVLMSLLVPEHGTVRVDGYDIFSGHTTAYRGQIAAVMQEDSLLSGSLADNICFFETAPDRAWIEECAKLAAIHQDIVKMPMKYATLVGDMGASLSGGQKQRVLLARALYARPKILFLDEATSHVDGATERLIHRSLASLRITRVIVTHRKETLEIADRTVDIRSLQAMQDSERPALVQSAV